MLRHRAGLRQDLLLPGQLDDLHAALGLASEPSLVRAQILARLCWALKREDRYAESEDMALTCAPSLSSWATRSTGSKPTWRWHRSERSGARTP